MIIITVRDNYHLSAIWPVWPFYTPLATRNRTPNPAVQSTDHRNSSGTFLYHDQSGHHYLTSLQDRGSYQAGSMAASKAGAVYLVNTKYLGEAVVQRWRDTLKYTQRLSLLMKVKALGLLPGSRSCKCEVVGVRGTVKLSSKALAHAYACGLRAPSPVNSGASDATSGSVGDSDSESSADCSSSDGEPVDVVQSHFSQLTASEWQKVDTFADQCTRCHPNIDKNTAGRLRRDVPKTPCDLFLEFFPLELAERRFDHWVQHAEQSGRRGLSNLDQVMFRKCCSLLMKMCLSDLRRREVYFNDGMSGVASALPQRSLENLLYTIRDAIRAIRHTSHTPYEPYEEHQILPGGREAWGGDPLRPMRRFADELQSHWQVNKPVFSMVVDKIMMAGLAPQTYTSQCFQTSRLKQECA
jgi:hypothetical protein